MDAKKALELMIEGEWYRSAVEAVDRAEHVGGQAVHIHGFGGYFMITQVMKQTLETRGLPMTTYHRVIRGDGTSALVSVPPTK